MDNKTSTNARAAAGSGRNSIQWKFYREAGYDSLVRWSPDWSEVVPNLAESWDVEAGGQAYVFHLRQGVKWSDGAEFTADDLVFTVDDVVRNEILTPCRRNSSPSTGSSRRWRRSTTTRSGSSSQQFPDSSSGGWRHRTPGMCCCHGTISRSFTPTTTNGELHLNAPQLTAGVTTVDNKPILAAAREDAGYAFLDGLAASMNYAVIALNLNHRDRAMRDVFQNKDFRIGLSHAINRDEIIDVAFQRQGEPWQAAPRLESVAFDEELAKQYTEYDVDLANEHLDR